MTYKTTNTGEGLMYRKAARRAGGRRDKERLAAPSMILVLENRFVVT